MYEYLNGVVVDINPAYIVIDVNGVGYLVNVANPYSFKADEKQKVYCIRRFQRLKTRCTYLKNTRTKSSF